MVSWWLPLQELDYSVEYRDGTKTGHVDAFSRNLIVSTEEPEIEQSLSVKTITSVDWLQLGVTELTSI